MTIKVFGSDYDLNDLKNVESLSDLIQESQVNSARQIAQTLLTAIISNNCGAWTNKNET